MLLYTLSVLWSICVFIQQFLAYGTAFRLTRDGGGDGISLFGWMLVLGLASLVPGLGVYIWLKNRD